MRITKAWLRSRKALVAGGTGLLVLVLVVVVAAPGEAARRRWPWQGRSVAPQPVVTAQQPSASAAAAAPSPSEAAPAPVTPSDHSAHTGTGTGLTFNTSLVPTGIAGSGALRVRTTGELPTPTPDGIGAFRNVCLFSNMNTDDPIVFPGQPNASHLHTFWGNTGVNASSTAQSIATTGNSTCRGGIANRSAYWAPAIIDTATGRPIAPELMHVYYKSGYYGIRPDQITAFPAGLRIVAGSAKATAPQEFTNWGCFGGTGGHVPTIPNNCPVGDHISMNLDFPQCWNGRDLDSADHKSHMAYPRSGACPSTHPVPIPVITYHVLYPVTAGMNTSTWRLSSDAYSGPGGYSIHGDWFDGWQEDIKQTWIANCVRKPVSCASHMLGDGRVMDGDR